MIEAGILVVLLVVVGFCCYAAGYSNGREYGKAEGSKPSIASADREQQPKWTSGCDFLSGLSNYVPISSDTIGLTLHVRLDGVPTLKIEELVDSNALSGFRRFIDKGKPVLMREREYRLDPNDKAVANLLGDIKSRGG